jgi:hypothetical protein
MAGKNPSDALEAYADPFKKAIGCLVEPHFGSHVPKVDKQQALFFRDGYIHVTRDAQDREGESPSLFFVFQQYYRIIEDRTAPRDERFRVTTDAWHYVILDADENEIISYHWNPRGSTETPHLHIRAVLFDKSNHPLAKGFSKLHLPTSRISIEQIVRFLLTDLKVMSRLGEEEWKKILDKGEREFQAKRSWPKNRHG